MTIMMFYFYTTNPQQHAYAIEVCQNMKISTPSQNLNRLDVSGGAHTTEQWAFYLTKFHTFFWGREIYICKLER